MNFQTLKAMIENLLKSFTCPMCNSNINETSIEVIGAAGSTVNLDIECPSCKKHALIKAELAYSDSNKLNVPKEKIEEIKNLLRSMGPKLGFMSNKKLSVNNEIIETINDAQIIELSRNLKPKNLSVSDLFGE